MFEAGLPPRRLNPDIEGTRASLLPLVGVQLDALKISRVVLEQMEPSQVGTIVGTLMDASLIHFGDLLPGNANLRNLGLSRHQGDVGEREGYPDFDHVSGHRIELKLLYVDPLELSMKRPPTDREASARLTQKVTVKNVDPENDILLILAYRLEPDVVDSSLYSPRVVDLGLFPMIEAIRARDHRLAESGGIWFGNFETPAILSRIGAAKRTSEIPLNTTSYGRKSSEGHDFNEDTNFGKLKRIPYRPLQEYLKKHGATYASSGTYPEPWRIDPRGAPIELAESPDDEYLLK